MKSRRIAVFCILALLLIAAIAGILDPKRRLLGRINGEPFFQDRPASAWRDDLAQPDGTRPSEAYEVLVAAKAEAVPICVWVLRNKSNNEARWRVVDVLAKIGQDAMPAAPELVVALSDSDPLIRGVAIRAIGELHPDVPGAVAGLVNQFPDANAIRAVSNFGAKGAEAVPALTNLLKDNDPTIRWQALRTLGKIHEPSLPALDEMIRLAGEDPDPLVREHAAEAIGDIGPTAANGIPTLVKALKDPVARVRRDAVRSLGQMGPAAKDALPEIRAAMNDPDSNVKTAATRAVRLIDPSQPDPKKQ